LPCAVVAGSTIWLRDGCLKISLETRLKSSSGLMVYPVA
jgi:hypothetical protein